MKKLLVIGLLCLLMGCSESPVDENGRHLAEKSGNSFVVKMFPGGGERYFHYVMVDGHEYLVMSGTHKSGLTHSPKCQCLKKDKAEIVLPVNIATNDVPMIVPL